MRLRRHKAAFTLVEMLVATALIMFIMLILSEAFVQGLDAFRLLKGIGDMEARLRSAVTIIRADLVADHFEGKRRLSDPSFWMQGNPREGYFSLSQGTTPTVGLSPVAPGQQTVTVQSTAGSDWVIQGQTAQSNGSLLLVDSGPFQEIVQVINVNPGSPGTFTAIFRLPHGFPPNTPPPPFLIRVLEGVDADLIPSMRGTDHVLAMTVKARGNRPEDFFSANLPYNPFPQGTPLYPLTSPFFKILPDGVTQHPFYASTTFFDQSADSRYQDILPPPGVPATIATPTGRYSSQWAEIGYFLVPNGTTANGTRLFALYRCQFVVVPDNSKLNVPPPNPANPPLPPSPPIPLSQPGNLAASWANDGYADMSCQPVNGNLYYYFNNPSDLANGIMTRAFVAATSGLRGNFDPTNSQVWSATLVVTDVVSFDVRILPDLPGYNTDFGDVLPVQGWPQVVYDTALPIPSTAPFPYPIKAVEITLRVWDMRTQQTRQITMIQDM